MSEGISLTSLGSDLISKNSRTCSMSSSGWVAGRPIMGMPGFPSTGMRADEADRALALVGERDDHLGDVVFEEALALRGKERQAGFGVGGIAPDDAEIAHVAFLC